MRVSEHRLGLLVRVALIFNLIVLNFTVNYSGGLIDFPPLIFFLSITMRAILLGFKNQSRSGCLCPR